MDVEIPTIELSVSDTDEERVVEPKSKETTKVFEPTKNPWYFDALTQKTVVQQEDSELNI